MAVFMMSFQKIFRTALDGCFYNFHLTLMITSYTFYKMCAQYRRKLHVKETFHLFGEHSLIIYNCCYDFEGT